MFAEMRKKNRELSPSDAVRILEKCEYGTLATVNENGYPYAVPLSYVYHGGKIYFHCAKNAGVKFANIERNPKVCFTVVGDTELLPEEFSTKYESVVVFGTAREVGGDTKQTALTMLIEKYAADFAEKGAEYIRKFFDQTCVVEICCEHMTSKGRK